MSETAAARSDYGRITALVVLVALLLLPLAWAGFNFQAESLANSATTGQEQRLNDLDRRLADLRDAGGLDRPAQGADGGLYFRGVTPAIAGAEMQRHVLQAIEAAGGRTIEARMVEVPVEEAEQRRVDLRIAFDARIAELQRILYDLETGVPVVMVRSIAVLNSGGNDNEIDPVLRIDILLSGYREAPLP